MRSMHLTESEICTKDFKEGIIKCSYQDIEEKIRSSKAQKWLFLFPEYGIFQYGKKADENSELILMCSLHAESAVFNIFAVKSS